MGRDVMVKRTQLVLHLERVAVDPPIACGSKALVEALADLLLEALGDRQAPEETHETGGVDEPEDHA
jgi:hypothetical protein